MRVPDIVFHPCREPSPERPPKPTVYRTGIRISLTPPPLRRQPPESRRTRSADSRRAGDSAGASWRGSSSVGSSGDLSGEDLSGGSESDTSDREFPRTPPRSRSAWPGRSRSTGSGGAPRSAGDSGERASDGTWRWRQTSDCDLRRQQGSGGRPDSTPDLSPEPEWPQRTPDGRTAGPQRRPSRPAPPPPVRCVSVDEDHHEGSVYTGRGRPRSWAGMELGGGLLERPRLLIGLASEEDVR
ncbi:hypothetical protein FJT64_004992 [Amphibalanus amphitrite]|uniref:Uncharacterized protein n=1 Tax=Amphibalanus amphitrite TaxID=1232801 RepID=A0A6A4VXI4_AMPAM|nr:hypothetical protein FJT64_004992 [Amphibalanus amphitrite]